MITVANGALLDYESAASHNITVLATSADGSSSTASFVINLGDVNEAPALTNAAAVNGASGAVLGVPGMNVSDPENGMLTLSLSVTNGSLNVTASGSAVAVGNGTSCLTLSGSVTEV